MTYIVIIHVLTDEGLTIEAEGFTLRSDADRFADDQKGREDVDFVCVTNVKQFDRPEYTGHPTYTVNPYRNPADSKGE
jgi:hypothetical protein